MCVSAERDRAVVGFYQALNRPVSDPGPAPLARAGSGRPDRITLWPLTGDGLERANAIVRGGDDLMANGLLLAAIEGGRRRAGLLLGPRLRARRGLVGLISRRVELPGLTGSGVLLGQQPETGSSGVIEDRRGGGDGLRRAAPGDLAPGRGEREEGRLQVDCLLGAFDLPGDRDRASLLRQRPRGRRR